MVRAVVWKELREQSLIAAMLAALGGALLFAAASFGDPPTPGAAPTDVLASLGAGRMLTLMLVVTAGTVCGGALFAAEREAGTMTFLETLPAARWALWRAKVVAGLALAAAEAGALMAVAVALGLADGPFLARLVIYALLAFSWGVLGSTLARTTLGSLGFAIPAAAATSFLLLIPLTLLFASPGAGLRPIGWTLFELLMLATPLAVSAWRFTAPDRIRAADAAGETPDPAADPARPGRRAGWGYRALVWLALRQLRTTGPVLSAFALAFGLSLLLPEFQPVFLWPVLALAAGVLAGITAFGDEQLHRTSLFWGEFRLPAGRAWWVKVGLNLALLGWLLFLLALPCVIRAQVESGRRFAYGQTALAAVFHSRLFDEFGSHGWKYLLVPPLYGFAFGHLCGLMFRKLVVACGVALVLGGVAAGLWGPSLMAGGLRPWQVVLPAALVLFTGRVLLRSWVTDRSGGRAALLRLAGGSAAALLALAAGLAFRAVQVPDEPGGEDDQAFVASLPTYDENVGGREFRMAAERFSRALEAARAADRPAEPRRGPKAEERLEAAVRVKWPEDDAELNQWIDSLYPEAPAGAEDKSWPALAESAAEKPVGVYDPPQLVSAIASTVAALDNARRMALVILARGLQQGARGQPARFVPAVRTVLALARCLRRGGGMLALETSIEVQRAAMLAAERWLDRLPAGGTGPARDLAAVLAAADDDALDLRPHLLADRYVVRAMMQGPTAWLTGHLTPHRGSAEQAASEADLVALAWAVPWERERTRRLVGLSSDPSRIDAARYLAGRPGGPILLGRARAGPELTERDLYGRALRRAVCLKAAVVAYQGDRGRAPAALGELVGAYLPRLPGDPYAGGQTFRYRVSAGEELLGPPRSSPGERGREDRAVVAISPGQAVIWSVGHDHTDQGGRVPPGGPRAEDLVFIVPPPAPRTAGLSP